jgi:hypothetical protein
VKHVFSEAMSLLSQPTASFSALCQPQPLARSAQLNVVIDTLLIQMLSLGGSFFGAFSL